ncbi:uncharacterized protein MELLADRAFT_61730 [Melampsora larici-populina 98AG31]|uniref:Uncharacterized protein n=1 Tax=Melampsora larici-populina (strain 98AG31 / pathotype 3-4-7) TaxID=747676 RepID=F4RGC4_MELLP|nr:uncharacterized protein MELLADRAFT_61730 [Melampsora larici-populina 98AG31]EGG08686.1 hypothetical protein MELLADRAFT_61730 [Melampsora larici-populina 98AG31]
MGPTVKNGTVETRGKLLHVNNYLSSTTQTNDIVATVTEQDEHRIHEPHCVPAKQVYCTACPHEFWLSRQNPTTPTGQPSSLASTELIILLSDLVHEMYSNWTMSWEANRVSSKATVTPYSNPDKWKTIGIDKATMDILWIYNSLVRICATHADPGRMLNSGHNLQLQETLESTITWSCQEGSVNSTYCELDDMKRVVAQMCTILFETYKRPSIDITQLVFWSRRSGKVKNLLNTFRDQTYLIGLSRAGLSHLVEYAESQQADGSQLETNETEKPAERLYCEDPVEKWDSDEDNVEHKKLTTYIAFIDYVICGSVEILSNVKYDCHHWHVALYFAPLRSAYQKYCDIIPSSTSKVEESAENPCTPWPEWAETHHTPHTVVPGVKTLTSPKSMYCLANKRIPDAHYFDGIKC